MSDDPIQDLLDQGGFRRVPDAESDRLVKQAWKLVHVALGLSMRPNPDGWSAPLFDTWKQVLALNEFGAGQIAAIEHLSTLWNTLVNAFVTFEPVKDDPLWTQACQIASALTVPRESGLAATVPPSLKDDDDLAMAVMTVLTGELAGRLTRATAIVHEINEHLPGA